MPTVYENWGHRKRCMEETHRLSFRVTEMRKDRHCRSCGKPMTWFQGQGKAGRKAQATCDHKLARSLGGSDTIDNFNLICSGCNTKKSKLENKILKTIRNTEAEVI